MAISERSRWLGALARRAFAQAAAVTAPSFDLLERARHLGASGDLDLIPWGVDPDVFRPNDSAASRVRERYGLGVDDVLIVAAGRFIPVKGFDHLIRAMHLAQAHTLGVHLVLLGDGDLRNDLMAEAESLGLSNLVSFPGMTPHHAVAAHLAAADIVAVPSVHYKGFVDGQPTVALEAMAVGKPLIATRVGGLPEIVEDGENGLLVDEGDVTGLADAIRRLASTAKLRARMGEQSRRRVLESLTWDNVAGELVEVFERVRVQT
jgi:phosphatidylinositol alpha-1,6-mannosyltransferase